MSAPSHSFGSPDCETGPIEICSKKSFKKNRRRRRLPGPARTSLLSCERRVCRPRNRCPLSLSLSSLSLFSSRRLDDLGYYDVSRVRVDACNALPPVRALETPVNAAAAAGLLIVRRRHRGYAVTRYIVWYPSSVCGIISRHVLSPLPLPSARTGKKKK